MVFIREKSSGFFHPKYFFIIFILNKYKTSPQFGVFEQTEYQNYKANNIATFWKNYRGHQENKHGFTRNRFCFIFLEKRNFY